MDKYDKDVALHGGNFPTGGSTPEFDTAGGGGDLSAGLSARDPFVDEMPEQMGMGTVGPNQMPIGCEKGSAKRGHRWG